MGAATLCAKRYARGMTWTKTTKKSFGDGPSLPDAIAAFWKFWPTVSKTIADAVVSGGMSGEVIEAVNQHVHAIDKSLDWELGPGRKSQHHICVSGKGDPVLRVIAERWLRAAPAPDETWEYYASRQPHGNPGLVLEIGGHRIELDDLVCSIEEDDSEEVLDLVVHHAVFGSITEKNLKSQIMFIGLDTLLGEDDVERWIGSLETADSAPPNAVPFAELKARIATFAPKCTGEKWSVLKGEKDGRPIFVSKNSALKRIDHLLLDMHVEIRITLRTPADTGLTTSEEAEVLNAMEDRLFAALGDDAVYVGRETHAGHRTMHLHVMESGPAAAKINTWRQQSNQYAIEVSVRPDTRWDVLNRWG
jgi:hypothetical protein